MATDSPGDEFVTIVPVGESRAPPADPAFVTVLTLGAAAGAAKVTVKRPRGERLGLGLKFEGGSAAAEKVRRLLVQSCTENSPAANACTPWGKLIPGDEILSIDNVSVSDLTRIDCVRRLKDSDEILTLMVRHFDAEEEKNTKSVDVSDYSNAKTQPDISKALPPPVPPRKFGKKNSFKEKSAIEQNITNVEMNKNDRESILNSFHAGMANNTLTKLSRKSSFDSHLHRQNKESVSSLRKGSPEEVRRLVRRLSDGRSMPPEAEVYIDLLSTEWERCLADAESDDTGSSISTVVDRLGSMASSVDNSITSTPVMQPKTIDIQKVLNCIENIDSDILKDINTTKILEKQTVKRTDSRKILENKIHYVEQPTITTVSKDDSIRNDKNNNNTASLKPAVTSTSTDVTRTKPKDTKTDFNLLKPIEKPKPMPRNNKPDPNTTEMKLKATLSSEATPPPPIPDTLLTPTKKTCIETWLQRSEAEMNSDESIECVEDLAPEALPRLIDFVPKPQFKESDAAPVALARPTSAPPLPPVDAREDGSGASLDTIGELDEPSDADIGKQKDVTNNVEASKHPSSFWDDRALKSDTEERSLSNDESPLPTCPRQPPDGVETPNDIIEKASVILNSKLPPRLPTGWSANSGNRMRLSYSRAQDPKSEASVKDKIAMFSNDRTLSSDRIDKCGTLPIRGKYTKTPNGGLDNSESVSFLDRRLTKSQDNLDEVPRTPKALLERPQVLGALKSTDIKPNINGSSQSQPYFYTSTTTLRPTEPAKPQPVYHVRSSSDDSGSSRKSSHKSNLEYLIEQRKKSMSKLRGLAIPEIQGPIMDLPEIKVQTKIVTHNSCTKNDFQITQKSKKTRSMDLNDSKWKSNLLSSNLPKYSPAFKRKTLQVYSPSIVTKDSSVRKSYDSSHITNNSSQSSKPTHLTIDITRTSSKNDYSQSSANIMTRYTKVESKNIFDNPRHYSNVEIKICTATEVMDSDNDSAMSSTQSSYRSSASSPLYNLDSIESDGSRVSPKNTQFTSYAFSKSENPVSVSIQDKNEEYTKRNVCRSVSSDTNASLSSSRSAGSGATSGSQASCSSLESTVPEPGKKKIVKTYSIDNVNRRNILALAKCRSGRDDKLDSPVAETKFSHEPRDRSPSPEVKSSERLSTLTPAVSANTNKGDTRRRSKVIETDSDSDSEVNLRQRRNDSRTKRNAIPPSKTKHIEVSEVPNNRDVPKVISEKLSSETNKISPIVPTAKQPDSKIINNPRKLPTETEEKETTLKKTSGKINICEVIDNISPEISLIDDVSKSVVKANQPQTQNNTKNQQIICLKKGAASGVGLILAGGTDCEAKDVKVHRVLSDSVADKAGLRRGARVCSINGCTMAGLTHAQSVAILKEQRSEVLIEVEYDTQDTQEKEQDSSKMESLSSLDSTDAGVATSYDGGATVTVVLEKAGGGAGLGFGLDGGRDSPAGDKPLTIKKLFAGGAAARSGCVCVGAELLAAGGQSMEGFTRTQAWAALKALPTGPVTLLLRNPKTTT